MPTPVILMADDDAGDRELASRAAAECYPAARFITLPDGIELMQYLRREGTYQDSGVAPRPGLILLDLIMPRKSGWDVLSEIRSAPQLRRIPIIALTVAEDGDTISRGYDLGVNAFITKPLAYDQLCRTMQAIGFFWFETAKLARE